MFGWEFPPYNSGGLGVACFGLTRALSARGFDVAFVMPKRLDVSSPFARMVFADSSDVQVRAVDSALSPYMTSARYQRERGTGGIYGPDLFAEVERYRAMGAAIAREETFDLIYAHDWLSFGPAVEAKRVSGKPLVVHMHATEYDRCGGRAGMNPHVFGVEKWGMDAADSIVAISEYTKQIIVREYGIPENKVRVVHNGIDEATTPAGSGWKRTRMLKDAGYKLVLFLGRLTLQKGPDHLLRAAKRVVERNPKVMFVISGSGDMEDATMQLAARLGIAGNVLFTGFLTGEDRHEVYTAADLFVMPSVSEPFGLAALEAMKVGTPVLLSKQSGVAEVVKNALKVDFWDIDEMANKILSVVGYPGLSETLIEHARTEADRLTWADAASKVDGIIRELVH